MTALPTSRPRARAARSLSALRMKAEISCGVKDSLPIRTCVPEPIRRLTESTVRSGAATAWLRACRPTMTAPASSSPTHDGRMASPPSSTIEGFPPATIATSEFVVPRSMPMMVSSSAALVSAGISPPRDVG